MSPPLNFFNTVFQYNSLFLVMMTMFEVQVSRAKMWIEII